jgi:hypothetical protein
MQELHTPRAKVGDMVLIDWPRSRWDGRVGLLHELRQETGDRHYGYVILDCIAMRIPMERIANHGYKHKEP